MTPVNHGESCYRQKAKLRTVVNLPQITPIAHKRPQNNITELQVSLVSVKVGVHDSTIKQKKMASMGEFQDENHC